MYPCFSQQETVDSFFEAILYITLALHILHHMFVAEFPVAAKEEGEERGKEMGGNGDMGKEGCGVLVGVNIAVSCLFSSEDQTIATSILKEQGGVQ